MLLYLSLVGLLLAVAYKYVFPSRELNHIPTIGYEDPILGCLTAIRYIFDAKGLVNEGYRKYPNRAFKFRSIDGWSIVINGTQYVKEIQKAALHQLDTSSGITDFFQFDHTLGLIQRGDKWHQTVLQTTFTRNIRERFDEIRGQVARACEDAVVHPSTEWVAVGAWNVAMDIVTKVTARYYVGSPLCENAEFTAIMQQAGPEIFKGGLLRYLPPSLRPLGARIITNVHSLRQRMETLIGPIIEERLVQIRVHGPYWVGKPNDLISWLIDGCLSAGQAVSVEDMASRMVFLEFASLFTVVSAATSALYDLSSCPPSVITELRDEIEVLTVGGGWSKDLLGKMVKLDSFFQESQRLHSLHIVRSARTALNEDFTFTDGLYLPKGATLSINTWNRHLDTEVYGPNPKEFDAFRFANQSRSHYEPRSTSPDPHYLSFGIGRAACPGRFFAAMIIKLMLAEVIMRYDIKPMSRTFPAAMHIEAAVRTNATATVMLRKWAEKQ